MLVCNLVALLQPFKTRYTPRPLFHAQATVSSELR